MDRDRAIDLAIDSLWTVLGRWQNSANFDSIYSEVEEAADILKKLKNDYSDVVDFPWGNPLNLEIYKVSEGLAQEIHELVNTIVDTNNLASTCDCDTCKEIEKITRLPVFG